jgi:hypothetical protein
MQRVDDRRGDPYARRRYNAYCGVFRDEHTGDHYERLLLWHPLLWWDVLRPSSLWRGWRLGALRSFWRNRKVFLFACSKASSAQAEAEAGEGEGTS